MATTTTDDHLKDLRIALKKVKAPYCSGVLDVDESNLLLYYGNEKGQSGRIDMAKASESELKRLSDACEPATFGRNQEDVLDPSYRKAGKMDEKYFATKLDLSSSGLLNIIRYGLLEGSRGARPFRADLYKLNIYDKGAFFKAHQDTPRGKEMFGTLVIVFPTDHEGGTLLLTHDGQEWPIDSGRLTKEKQKTKPDMSFIVFATFFGDVEHEVTPVVSGYRVTLTYNLYFDSNAKVGVDLPLQVTAQTIPPEVESFKTTFSRLLADEEFLPKGGSIGFGLFHQYPIVRESGNLDGLDECLKGRDAMIMQVCRELSLDANLWLLYYDRDTDTQLLAKNVLPVDATEDWTFSQFVLHMNFDVRVVKFDDEAEPDEKSEHPVCNIVWVNKIKKLNTIETKYAAYGNETFLTCVYADVCLVVDVGPPNNRVKEGNGKEHSDEK